MYTSLLYLPWVIKPLWSPFVDIIRTKRWWIMTMQILMSVAFALTALSLPHPSPEVISAGSTQVSLFVTTLILFWVTAFASATHDIAADGFYMLALDPSDQSFYVGIRSTFYRLSSIFGQGVLVVIAGLLESRLGDVPKAWSITLLVSSAIFAAVTLWHTFSLPRPSADSLRGLNGSQTNPTAEIFNEFGRTFVTFFQKKGVLTALSVCFFLPGAMLLRDADRQTAALIRNLAAASLGLTLLALVANFLSFGASDAVGDALYAVLVILSSPMVCSGYWLLSLFLWACLLIVSQQILKKKR